MFVSSAKNQLAVWFKNTKYTKCNFYDWPTEKEAERITFFLRIVLFIFLFLPLMAGQRVSNVHKGHSLPPANIDK